ncbi:MAG: hypothetical protein LBR70_00395 [Lactobacillaceae bacterium]|jgi:hypothetical protein|nr:hypothetical protein [Lactobacillaceae bacterium]
MDNKNIVNLVRAKSFFDTTPSDEAGYSSVMFFNMYDEEKKVGDCAVSIHANMTDNRGEKQLYPDSWYKDKASKELLPILEVDGYSTIGSQGKGYGRLGYQKVYELSVKTGCGGRIITMPTFTAGNFYEKLGMQTPKYLKDQHEELKKEYNAVRQKFLEEGHGAEKLNDIMFGLDDGKYADFVNKTDNSLKYFDPTQENLLKLYKGAENRIKQPDDMELISEGAKLSAALNADGGGVEFIAENEDDIFSFTDETGKRMFFNKRTGEFEDVGVKVENVKSRMRKDEPSPAVEKTEANNSISPEVVRIYKELKGHKK